MLERKQRKTLEKALGHRFRNRQLLVAALTHPSYRHEQSTDGEDNQRLEFLGDAAWGLAAAADLYHRHPQGTEGDLTHRRSLAANRNAFARIARSLDLGTYLFLGRGEERSGGRERTSNLADAMEALIGALYLDGGPKAVDRAYQRFGQPVLADLKTVEDDNPKGRLQEYCQQKWKVNPHYEIIEVTGPAHAKAYVCAAQIKDERYGEGRGMTKRAAESMAARETLRLLNAADKRQDD